MTFMLFANYRLFGRLSGIIHMDFITVVAVWRRPRSAHIVIRGIAEIVMSVSEYEYILCGEVKQNALAIVWAKPGSVLCVYMCLYERDAHDFTVCGH